MGQFIDKNMMQVDIAQGLITFQLSTNRLASERRI